MWGLNKRVKAFTLMEMTVAMLIFAIAIGLTYTIYEVVQQSYSQYKARNEQSSELMRLDELLSKDFSRSNAIYRLTDGLQFQKDSAVVTYHIQSEAVIRQAAITDTFKFVNTDIDYRYEGTVVDPTDTAGEQARIDEFEIRLILNKDTIPYHYHKSYSSLNLIQRKAHAER